MELRYTPTEDDLSSSWRDLKAPRFVLFLYILLLSLLALVGLYLIEHDFASIGWLWMVLPVVIGIAAFEVPRMRARRAFKRNPSIRGEIIVTLNDEGTAWKYPTGESRLDWRTYIKYRETKAGFLLYLSPERTTFIPKRVMSAEQIEEHCGACCKRKSQRNSSCRYRPCAATGVAISSTAAESPVAGPCQTPPPNVVM